MKDYSFDKRDDFSANAKALAAKMDVHISEVRANYSEAKASASRKSAMEELKNSEADYKESPRPGTATAHGTARKNVLLRTGSKWPTTRRGPIEARPFFRRCSPDNDSDEGEPMSPSGFGVFSQTSPMGTSPTSNCVLRLSGRQRAAPPLVMTTSPHF